MRKWILILGIFFLAVQAGGEEVSVLKTQKDKLSYGFGVDVVRNLKRQGIEVDADLLMKGIRDALSGGNLLMTDDEIRKTIITFQAEVKQKRARTRATLTKDVEQSKKEGEAFLAANKTKEGVVTLPSGLQYMILKAGNGRKPTDEDTIEVHYRGALVNGTEFENTHDAGKPATIKVSDPQVIAGLREAFKLMPVGSKWQLFIPPRLAYGPRGVPPHIGPSATLIYEMELLAIK